MTNHRTERLRVAPPTLEPDPVFLGVLAELGASSRPLAPTTARSAGLRMIVATASVAVIAAATWAAGTPSGEDIPLSPTDSPTHLEPSGPPSHGNVGTPQPDVSTSPGSPLSPGLPGKSTSRSERAADAPRLGLQDPRPGKRKGADKGRKVGPGQRPGERPDEHRGDREGRGEDRDHDRRGDALQDDQGRVDDGRRLLDSQDSGRFAGIDEDGAREHDHGPGHRHGGDTGRQGGHDEAKVKKTR